MADLTFLLKDRRDVFRKRRSIDLSRRALLLVCRKRRGERQQSGAEQHRQY
jgi:hypothetical protein